MLKERPKSLVKEAGSILSTLRLLVTKLVKSIAGKDDKSPRGLE